MIKRLSLRSRLLALIVVLFTAGMVLTNAAVAAAMRPPLVERVDSQLAPIATALTRISGPMLDQFQQSAALPKAAPAPLALDLLREIRIVQLNQDGDPVRTIRAGTDTSPQPSVRGLSTAEIRKRGGEAFQARAPGGINWRAVATTGPDGTGWLVMGSLREVDATVTRVRTTGLAIGAGVLLLLAVLAAIAVRAGLAPLRRIEETAAAIAGGDLTRRITLEAGPRTEIGRLGSGLNGMLERIETAVAAQAASEARMRRFVADASHELRTPLAGIKGFAELHRLGGEVPMDRIEREATRLALLVEDLLLLARLDSTAGLRTAPMDLRALAADALADLRALAPDRQVELTGLDGGPVTPAPATGDEVRLRQVVSNLIGNAVAHTPAGSPIRIGVGARDGVAILEVADHGPGVPADLADRVFERFYRADASRARDAGGGAGLGLAIAQSVVHAHGGRITLVPTPGGGATFRLELPAATDAADGDQAECGSGQQGAATGAR
jgi:two-component system OmpR family sensor kinase